MLTLCELQVVPQEVRGQLGLRFRLNPPAAHRQRDVHAIIVQVQPADRGLVPRVGLSVRPIGVHPLLVEHAVVEHDPAQARHPAGSHRRRPLVERVVRILVVPVRNPLVADGWIARSDHPQLGAL